MTPLIPPFARSRTSRLAGVASLEAELGHGTLLAKIDVESAYRLIPVHPSDRSLLGIQWKGKVCNGMLPFCLRSAPKLFTTVADALEWRCCGPTCCTLFGPFFHPWSPRVERV